MEKKSNYFKNIIGYEKEKRILEKVIDVLNNKEKYEKLGSSLPHGLFIYGNPGLGKTTFSKEILKSVVNRKTYIVRKVKSNGDFINYMNDIFKQAKNNQPSVILLDDLDKFAEDDDTVNSEEFVAVQSLIDDIKGEDIFIIATANDKKVLPNSLLRSGRFDIKIEISYPKEEDAFKIFKYYLKKKKVDKDINIKNISYVLGVSSCADLEKVCNQAGIYAGYKNKDSIGMDDLLRAALEVSYDTNIEAENTDNKYSLNIAYHEAGHALVGEYLEPNSISFVTIAENDSNTRGLTQYHDNEYYWYDIDFLKKRLITLLAGKAATEIIYNKCDIGTYSDLRRAYSIADKLVDAYCLFDFNSKVDFLSNHSEKVKLSKDDNVSKLITQSYNKAKEIILENKDYLHKLAKRLNNKKILFQDEIREILNQFD